MTEERKFRLKTIDGFFHGGKEWKQDELLKKLNEVYFKKYQIRIGLRMFQEDMSYLKENLSAPIERKRGEGRKFIFYYKNPDFTIKNQNFDDNQLAILQDATTLLEQMQGLVKIENLDETLLSLHTLVDTNTERYISFEENDYDNRGHLMALYEAIKAKKPLLIGYKEFGANAQIMHKMSPYYLKEYRNRWYVVGRVEENKERLYNLPLDRIEAIKDLKFMPFRPKEDGFDAATYFQNVIGVTVYTEKEVETVRFKVTSFSSNYLKTKKLHHSQIIIEENADFIIFSLQVKINYELEAELRRFGAALQVLEPVHLREKFKAEAENLLRLYQEN